MKKSNNYLAATVAVTFKANSCMVSQTIHEVGMSEPCG